MNTKIQFIFFGIAVIGTFLSCHSTETMESHLSKKVNRYSTDADTIYITNSTEIEHVERTFYKKYHTQYTPYIAISNIVGKPTFSLSALEYDGDELQAQTLINFKKKGSFEHMLNVIDTILNNPGKELRFDLEDGYVYSSNISSTNAMIYQLKNPLTTTKTAIIRITEAERDSLRLCFDKYNEETQSRIK